MAATKRNRSSASDPLHGKTRAKIRTTQLVNRLNANALGELKNQKKEPIEMSDGQIRSALGLLDRTLPKLTATELSGVGGKDLIPKLTITKNE